MARNSKKKRRSPVPAASVPAAQVQPVAEVVKSGKLEKRVTVRFDAREFAVIEDYARREGFTVSLLLRRSLLQSMRRAGVLPPA